MRTEITPVTIAVTCPFTSGSAVIGLIGASIGCPMFDAFMSCFMLLSMSSSSLAFVFVFPARCLKCFSRPRPPRIIIIVITCCDDLDDDDDKDDDRLSPIRVAHVLKLVVIVKSNLVSLCVVFPSWTNFTSRYTRVSTRKRTRFVSCRTEKEAETGLQEEIIFIEEEEEEEDHG